MSLQQVEVSNRDLMQDDKLMLLTLHSSALKGRGNVSVYNAYSDAKDLPIVILMHGVYGNHWVWMHLGGVHEVYNRLRAEGLSECVLVMPEDGSYYAGSGYLPLKHADYDKWIVDDLIEGVQKTCDCVSENSKLFISGLSMGGYGALRLGAKYADRFSGISGHSSITDIKEIGQFVDENLDHYELDDNAESEEADILYWLNKNRAHLPPLRFDCGREDQLFQGNLQFKERLENAGLEFSFTENAGTHEWPYWNTHVADTFAFFDNILKKS